MRRTLFLVPLILGLSRSATAVTEPVSVSFHECRRCSSPPTLDGRLDDACWKNLPLMEGFYQYWSPTPKPPPLKTVAKLCCDDSALYIGIILYDEQVEKIKATIRNRDNPETAKEARMKFNELAAKQAQSLSPSAASVLRENALALRRETAELKWEGLLWSLVGAQ